MSKIRSSNTKPERLLFTALEDLHYSFEKHSPLPGKPDIVFKDIKLIIFIDGDFWHGYTLKTRESKLPEYWVRKIRNNIRRDRKRRTALRNEGWKVIRIWEHRIINNLPGVIRTISKVVKELEEK